jgi:phenylacetate-CoA ligase
MSFFHLRIVPSCQWPPLPDALYSQVWNAYLELERTQWLTSAEIERHQLRQVRSLLAHCIANVPYYRRILAEARIDPQTIQTMDDFRRIPLLPRRTYQEQHASFVATQLPPGTTAEPVTSTPPVYRTNMTSLWWHAFFLRDLEWARFDSASTLATIRPTGAAGVELQRWLQGVSFSTWSSSLDALIEIGPAHSMDIRQDPRLQLQWLRRIAPDYLMSTAVNLETLAELAQREGTITSLRGIQSIAGVLTPACRSAIEAAFGVPVRQLYTCGETGYLASSCPEGRGLHVHAENVILELLDAENRPCKPGKTGRVFVTHLHNLRGPFLRFELGDEASWAVEPCSCGRGLPLLENVQGMNQPAT